ncbi:MAG: hydantoinase B/oxoprolinase family protein [Martelella sp.]|uniref:hydantoinase B/oxoprolinase family protein n=1 Tax=Martelella sp. TaxID=1969699 RepID=UPI003241CEB0
MDPVRTAIMNARFSAIVEEASATLHRTAHTTFVKLVQDYQCALSTVDGDIFAYPSKSGVTVFIGLPLQGVLRWIDFDTLEPGDVILTNDPFASDGVVTHMMDVTMISPIFHDGKLIAFGWSFVHASDIGGAVPGSISPAFTEFYQEGMRIRPVMLLKGGRLQETVRNFVLDNSRTPNEVWGDMQAMISALKSMDRRLNELCGRYGADEVVHGMQDVIALAEIKARGVYGKIPDGSYEFADFVEGIDEGEYYQIKLKMTVEGDSVALDFTGTDPQMPSAYNFICGGSTHPYICQALVNYVLTVLPDAPKNAGLLRPITTNVPRGTLINAEPPAAMGSRVASGTRVYDTVIGCLNEALPDGLIAAGAGMSGIIVVSARDRDTGRTKVSVVNPICGGGGGRAIRDGVDGVDGRVGALKSVPTEVIEMETVLMVRQYRMLTDTQAPGKWRGGAALVMDLENTAEEATITVRGMNRFHFRPWGVKGGAAGRLARVLLNPETDRERDLGKIVVLKMGRGEMVRMLTPAGGGFGNPLERPVELVAEDIEAGFISRDRARDDYGVIWMDGAVDTAATGKERQRRLGSGVREDTIVFGEERMEYDRLRPEPIRSYLAGLMVSCPADLRRQLVRIVGTAVRAETNVLTKERAQEIFDAAITELNGEMPSTDSKRSPVQRRQITA